MLWRETNGYARFSGVTRARGEFLNGERFERRREI
jgi:hypothetical protein